MLPEAWTERRNAECEAGGALVRVLSTIVVLLVIAALLAYALRRRR
jgi:hypothetical protein